MVTTMIRIYWLEVFFGRHTHNRFGRVICYHVWTRAETLFVSLSIFLSVIIQSDFIILPVTSLVFVLYSTSFVYRTSELSILHVFIKLVLLVNHVHAFKKLNRMSL